MKLKNLLIVVLFIASNTFSQENKKVLFSIDGEPFYTSEFLNVYKKNLNLVVDSEVDKENYLKLFINYKLKVKEAKSIGLDTLKKYKKELKKYKNNLISPYLQDKEVTKKLVNEAYERLKNEVNVNHILIFLKPSAPPRDTLAAYNKLIKARNLIIRGSKFEEIAKIYSNDPTVEQNGGSIGYFTVLQMVYPFENVAFTTPVNEISMPFRTKFGYHILKVNAKRKSKGKVEVAHFMLKNDGLTAKKRIDSVYGLLNNKIASFSNLAKKLSEDSASAINGGKLKKMGVGQMIEKFSNIAFSLKNEGDISKPFKTKLGWHIIKLTKKYPIESFEKIEEKLTREVEKDVRSNLSRKSVIDKLLKQYKISANEQSLQQFELENWKKNPEKFLDVLLSINDKKIGQKKFINYLKTGTNKIVKQAFPDFIEEEVLDYYKEYIEFSNVEFAVAFNEFKEGLLLFDLLEKQVWEKATENIGLLNYFRVNKEKKYYSKELKSIKGTVISDYQNYLELVFVKQLRKKYEVKINKSELKRIKKLNL
ncbi:MAG: peptidylprolyl isomerase [Lutibacter sp.]|nr:MAG: peptidylprolyl isomerase [Lutibacter sp.]